MATTRLDSVPSHEFLFADPALRFCALETWREMTRDDGSPTIVRGERVFASGDRVMFLKNDRELGVKNGSLGMVMSVNADSMRVTLDGTQERQIGFELRNYAAVDYGYAATVHRAQGATVDRTFVLAAPAMDRHLSYVGMTRHRQEARLYAGNDDFKDFEALKKRLSRTRPKDSTLDYAQRRGFEVAVEPASKLPHANLVGGKNKLSTRSSVSKWPSATSSRRRNASVWIRAPNFASRKHGNR